VTLNAESETYILFMPVLGCSVWQTLLQFFQKILDFVNLRRNFPISDLDANLIDLELLKV
jgi:hypothetical protein